MPAERQLVCVAEASGGEYFRAENPAALVDALDKVVQVAALPAPAPEPTRVVHFHDDYSGANLDEYWMVLNPDPNAYIVDGGELLMTNAGGVKGLQAEDTPNIIRLDYPLPDGDWDLIARLRVEFKTRRDSVWFGLYTDAENFLAAHAFTAPERPPATCWPSTWFAVPEETKHTSGDRSGADGMRRDRRNTSNTSPSPISWTNWRTAS